MYDRRQAMSMPEPPLGTTPDTTEGRGLSQERWTFIVIPVCIVLGIGLLALVMTVMRRRFLLSGAGRQGFREVGGVRTGRRCIRGGGAGADGTHIVYASYGRPGERTHLHYPHPGRQRRDRDLEETLTRGFRAGYGHRQPRVANRWAWANGRAFGRREEGLNELGEAPPPYIGRQDNEEWKPATEGVELAQLSDGDGENRRDGVGGAGGANDETRGRGESCATPPSRPSQQSVPLPLPPQAVTPARSTPPTPASNLIADPVPSPALGSPPAYTESPVTTSPGVTTTVTEIAVPERAALGAEMRS